RQTSAVREATSKVNNFLGGSGDFPPNAPVDPGKFLGGHVRLSGTGAFRWHATADVLGGEGTATGRIHGEVRHGVGKRTGFTVRLKGGIATRPTLRQSAFRLGGVGTVRGHQYGVRRGQAFWATQLDFAPLPGRIRPVVFLDAGQVGGVGSLFAGRVLAGAGAGVSLFGGLLRFNLSRALAPDDATLRFDIVVQAAR
ncbi:MAG: ShlB/FhaC/HecB family hemolysin secretion/activation protein, partial [Gemmatimonadales bacterium]